ncbi:MAG: NYN domain-containing protein [Candidatus Dependentiae bacterium]|nr:NYN domain-containing protein [Candidatus Dependentiae bacterium]
MIILIDAYNLFKTVLHVKFISDQQRIQFLQLFEKYAQLRPNNQVILVFDGGQDFYEIEQNYKHITLLYSGAMQIADDVIKKKLYELQSYDILLITCDRELRRYAANYQIESLGSLEFYKILQDIIKQQNKQEVIIAQTIYKTTMNENNDLDILMELGSRRLMIKDKDQDLQIEMRISHNRFDTKKDKKLLKKIAKI